MKTLTRTWTLLLALPGISSNISGAEPAADVFRSVVTAENLDLGHTNEFPANPELQTLEAARREAFFLSLLGVRGSREESRGGWRTGATEERQRHLRVAFKEPLPVGTILGAGGAVSYLKPDAPFPGDVNDDAQWVSVPLPAGQAGLRVWTFPPGVFTRALRSSFSDTPAPGTPSRSGFGGALILAERLHNLTPEADAYASSERSGEGTRTPNAFRVGNLVNELAETKLDGIGYPYAAGEWTAAPAHDVSREHPQWVVLSWPEAKTFCGVGLLNAFAKEIEIDALNRNAAGHPATAPESAWNKVGAVTWPVWWRPSYTAVQVPFAEPVMTRALRVRIVKTLSDENPDIVGHFDRNPQDRNRHVRLGGVMAFTTLGDKPIPPRPTRAEEPPLVVRYTMPYAGTVAVAIDDAKGRRVRNLVADVERSAGAQAEPWDGRDEAGNLVPPGTYTVKAITHQPLHLTYRGTVNVSGNPPWNTSNYNQRGPGGWLSDHEPPNDVTAIGDLVFVSAQVAESGHGILACDLDGNKLWGTHRFGGPNGLCYAGFLAHDGGKVYTAGMGWGSYLGINDRQYMVADPRGEGGPLLLIGEFRKDRVVPLAVVGNADRWWPLANDPALRRLTGDRRLEELSFAWSDRDGDGQPQPGEVELFDLRLDPTYWPTVANARLEVQMGGRVLKPVEFTACGAPVYKPLAATPHKLPAETVYATAIDRQGRVLINGNPLTSLDATGHVVWTYPNRFVGVHGAQGATEPRPGQLAGPLGFVGQEELPGVGEVFMLSSNIGQWYLFTADGLLAATVWHDHRTPGVHSWDFPQAERGLSLDRVTLGGEHFGGSFQRADDGKYYLVAGHHHNSVVELTGLEGMRRLESKITVRGDDLAAVEAWRMRRDLTAARKAVPKVLALAAPPAPVKPDGDLGEWDASQFTAIGKRGAFAVRSDKENLYVAWRVDSGQPLRNAGDEPQLLFKTGDSVDLQIGVNPDADANRTQPAPGDQRLLISLFQGKPIGVLYRHRVPGTPEKERIGFSSPWRTEYVDRIDRLASETVGIARTPTGYAVEAVVPLQLLGFKPQPGKSCKIDFGILSADSGGSLTAARTYWANQATGLVNDVPGEIMLHPVLWGTVRFTD